MSLNLSMTRLKTGLFYLDVFQQDGTTPQSLVAATLWFHASVGGIVLDKNSSGAGITILNSAGGANCAQLEIAPSETASISVNGARGDCELTMVVGSQTFELAKGTLEIVSNVGTP